LLLWLKAVLKTYLDPEPQPLQEEFDNLTQDDKETFATFLDREIASVNADAPAGDDTTELPIKVYEAEARLQGIDLFDMHVEEVRRTSGALPKLEHCFPVCTVPDFLSKNSSKINIQVRLCHAADMTPSSHDDDRVGDVSVSAAGDDRRCVKCGRSVEQGQRECKCGAKLGSEVQDLTVDMRGPIPTFISRIMEAFAIDPQIFSLWLFMNPALPDAPCFCTEDFNYDTLPPTMRGDFRDAHYARRFHSANKMFLDLATKFTYSPGVQGRWIFYVVLMNRQSDPELTRPVKVQFYNSHVQEVGSSVFHVPVRREEDAMQDSEGDSLTGRPAFHPADLMKLVREFLGREPALCAQLSPPTMSPEQAKNNLALRLLDVFQARIRSIARFDAEGQQVPSDEGHCGSNPSVWPSQGDNFLSSPLRIEPDWDAPSLKDQGEASRALSMVEVFHTEPNDTCAFGQPCILYLSDGDDPAPLLQEKLQVSGAEFAKWQVNKQVGSIRTPIDADDAGSWAYVEPSRLSPTTREKPSICVERRLPFRRSRSPDSRALRMKPLTIRGGNAERPPVSS